MPIRLWLTSALYIFIKDWRSTGECRLLRFVAARDQLVGPGVLHTTGLACADSDSLEHKHCGRQPPAPIELTDLIFGWHNERR